MNKLRQGWLALITILLLTACGEENSKGVSQNADSLIETAYKRKDYNKILQLADSLERTEALAPTKAYYWMGYASDRMKKMRMAEFYWKSSLEAAANSTSEESVDIYAKSASRLANLLSVRGDYENALKIAIPQLFLDNPFPLFYNIPVTRQVVD